jgi:hypothetical protein
MNPSLRSSKPAPIIALAALLPLTLCCAQELPQAGPEHQLLKRMEGAWTASIKSDAGASTGTMVCKLACNGLWLTTEFTSDFGGQSYQGRGLDGYDPAKKKYVSVWVDSMSTRPLLFEGEMDATGKVLTMIGEGPGFDGQPTRFKSVTRHVDGDHLAFGMFVVAPDGSETQVMSIDYVRKK